MIEHIILGVDDYDAELQRDLWLEQHPGIRINRVHAARRQPSNSATRFSDKTSPRTLLVDYELPEVIEHRQPVDIAAQYNELQRLRAQVYKAEADFHKRYRSGMRQGVRRVVLSDVSSRGQRY